MINLVKKAGTKLEKVPKRGEKVKVLELDELCVNFKKTSGFEPQWTVLRSSLLGFKSELEKQNISQNLRTKLVILMQSFMR